MLIFSVKNHHVPSCGEPDLDVMGENETGIIRSYYENEHGEQWVGVFRIENDDPYIVGGDIDWNEKYYLDKKNGRSVDELVLNEGERLWLAAFSYVVNNIRKLKSYSKEK